MAERSNSDAPDASAFRDVCVVGAGAIGGWIGAGLARAGCRLSLLARGATLAALRSSGLQLSSGSDTAAPTCLRDLRASAHATELGAQDLVVLAVKAPALPALMPQLGPLLRPDTPVLTLMNGVPWWFPHGLPGPLQGHTLESVDPGGVIGAAIDTRRVIGGVVHASCAATAPAVIRHGFGNTIILGEPSGARSARVQALCALLRRAGFEAPVSDRIQRDIWYKLWGNMTVNPISAFTGADATELLDDPLVLAFCTRVMLEARAVGAGFGVPIDQQPADRHATTRKLGRFKSSMLQDVEAGKPVELDALLASVRELGQLVGVPTPEIDTLFGLARLHARVHGLYR